MRSLIVAHDAGGAECLSAFLRAEPRLNIFADIYAEGPAVKVFNRNHQPVLSHLPNLYAQYDRVVTGSSMGATLENRVVECAERYSVTSVTLLEHWLHYPERFTNLGYQVLPDEIWVTDTYAQQKATACFSGVNIQLKPNWYWDEVRDKVTQGDEDKWLFAMENRTPQGESCIDNLEAFNHWFNANGATSGIVRPHPCFSSLEQESIAQWLRNKPHLRLSDSDLIDDLCSVSGVVGFQTTVLALAVYCSKKAVSLLPNTEQLVIPFPQIRTPFGARSDSQY